MTSQPSDFRAIYEAHFDFVWRSLRRLGVRESDARDQAQKVFLAAHAKLPEFKGQARLSTWLFGFCQRVASDYRRSAPIRREIAVDASELDAYGASQVDAAARSEVGQRARIAEAILERLPEAQRVVFVLFELEELSGDEIAALLEISVGTVRSRLRLAREQFGREVRRLAAIQAGHGRKQAV
jgi:RNA polymerase sigma-70 factor (ECF subfamily)